MKFFKILTIGILSIILVFSLTSLIIGLSLTNLLKEQTYQNALEETDGYKELQSLMLDSTITISEKDFKFLVDTILNKSLPYLKGEKEDADLTLNLTPYIMSFYFEELKSVPTCTTIKPTELCKPPSISDEEFLQQMLLAQDIDVNELGEIDLKNYIDENNVSDKFSEGIKTYYKIMLGLAFLAIISGILIYVVVKQRYKASEIIDIDLFFVAFSMFIFSYFVSSNINNLVNFEIPLKNTFLYIFEQLLQIMTAYGALIMVLGMVLTAITLVLAIEKRPPSKTIFKKKK